MSKAKKSSPSLINQTNVIILAGLLVAALGYFGYRSLLTNPDINVIGAGGDGSSYTLKTEQLQQVMQKRSDKTTKPKDEENKRNPGKSQTGGGTGFGPNNKAVDQR